MEWKQLLSKERLGRFGQVGSDARSPFQRDYDRIVFSSAFRRLQDKTQVFPLAESDYVRTRLTHSLEASCVGRSLGTLVGDFVLKQSDIEGLTPQDFGNIVAAACVAHDIGNPPFGHSGEDAIRDWFKTNETNFLESLQPSERADFLEFEGNAQGFRILTRLQQRQNDGGLQLSYAVLGAFSKYPRASAILGMDRKKVSEKKFGFFQSETGHFEKVAQGLGLKKKPDRAWCRHPLAFLTEAADDICYLIIDFEDGYRRGHVPFLKVESLFKAIAFEKSGTSQAFYNKISDERQKIEYLRARVINNLILAVVEIFKENVAQILDGNFEQALMSLVSFRAALDEIEKISVADVYGAPTVVQIETAGFEVLGGLLHCFVPALLVGDSKRSSAQSKMLALLPPEFRTGTNQYEKLLNATDFVSGMTDSFALTLFRRLKGIELPRG